MDNYLLQKKMSASCSFKKYIYMPTSHLLGAFLACCQWEGVWTVITWFHRNRLSERKPRIACRDGRNVNQEDLLLFDMLCAHECYLFLCDYAVICYISWYVNASAHLKYLINRTCSKFKGIWRISYRPALSEVYGRTSEARLQWKRVKNVTTLLHLLKNSLKKKIFHLSPFKSCCCHFPITCMLT